MSSRSTVAAIGESPSYVISGVHMLYAKLSSHFILVRSEYIHDLMKYIRGGGNVYMHCQRVRDLVTRAQ